MTQPPDTPYRVVAANLFGWHQIKADGDEPVYARDDGRGLPPERGGPLDFARLTELHGPLRPVILPSDDDQAAIKSALVDAGRQAMVTLAVVLHGLAMADVEQHPRGIGVERGSILTAGRGGSWESAAMQNFVWSFGDTTKESRIDAAAREVLAEVLGRWVNGADGYVEVAENLAGIISEIIDDSDGDVDSIADRWLLANAGWPNAKGWAASRSQAAFT